MKLVKEHINFERGLDPKDAMGTGDIHHREMKNMMSDLAKEYGSDAIEEYIEGKLYVLFYYLNFRFLIRYYKDGECYRVFCEKRLGGFDLFEPWTTSPYYNINKCKELIKLWIKNYFY